MRRIAWWHALIGVIVALGLGVVGSAIGSAILGAVLVVGRGGRSDLEHVTSALVSEMQSFPVMATSLVLTALGFTLGAFVGPLLARIPAKEALGLRRAPGGTFVAASIGIVALGPTSDWIVRGMRIVAPTWTFGTLDQLAEFTRSQPFLVLFPFVALMPGWGEELLFRGLVQRSIGRRGLAIAVSAIGFALIHMDPHHVAGVLPLGFFLAWTAARTDSTWVTIAAHVTNNTVALLSSQLGGEGSEDEPAPLWAMFVGWAIAAACIAVIVRLTRAAAASTVLPVAPIDDAPHGGDAPDEPTPS